MARNLLKRNQILVLMLAMMTMILGITVTPTRAASVSGGQSAVSFTVHIDRVKPKFSGTRSSGDGGQLKIPKNGQVIHYTAAQEATTTGRLLQTGVLKSSSLCLLGAVTILLVIMWYHQQRGRRETQDVAK
ncbi:hypothetical protein GKC32_11005 (plasmid) [Lactobacillus curvatus]|nr:hypothetical protein [Latilactobacillus curvatus]MSD84820.1 hypothetical protein [Latilactobacillus curvatus]MSE22870.1 hypothetical protein [Latilactobacillus curvatus]MSE24964.1 hypothetical protein [Latilactobacillus curvatus]